MPTQWSEAESRTTPVTDGCLWCKDESPPALRTPVGDSGEYLCPNCLGDLREFKRFRMVDLIVSSGLSPALQRIVLDHWDAVRLELAQQYDGDADLFPMPRRLSNATGHTHEPNYSTEG